MKIKYFAWIKDITNKDYEEINKNHPKNIEDLKKVLNSHYPDLKKHMNTRPKFISENSTASLALSLMNKHRITSLLVTSEKNLNSKHKLKDLKGIVHIHSILQHGIKWVIEKKDY